jgi:hypothetical protein
VITGRGRSGHAEIAWSTRANILRFTWWQFIKRPVDVIAAIRTMLADQACSATSRSLLPVRT